MKISNVMAVEISSWAGVSLNAEHFYASLVFYDANGEYQTKQLRHKLTAREAKALNKKDGVGGAYSAGCMTERFDSVEDVHQAAIEEFKQIPHAKVLMCGRHAVLEPQMVLIGPEDYKVRVNQLAARCKKLDWNRDERKLQKICDEFDALNEAHGIVP